MYYYYEAVKRLHVHSRADALHQRMQRVSILECRLTVDGPE